MIYLSPAPTTRPIRTLDSNQIMRLRLPLSNLLRRLVKDSWLDTFVSSARRVSKGHLRSSTARRKLISTLQRLHPSSPYQTESLSVPLAGTRKSRAARRLCESLKKKLRRASEALHQKKPESLQMPNSGSKRKGHLKFFLEWLLSNIEDWISIIDIQGQDSADEPLHPAAEEPLDPFQDLMHSLDCPRSKGTEISSVQGLVVDTVPSAEVGPEETWARIAKAMEDLGIPADVVMGQQSNTMH